MKKERKSPVKKFAKAIRECWADSSALDRGYYLCVVILLICIVINFISLLVEDGFQMKDIYSAIAAFVAVAGAVVIIGEISDD